MSMTEKMGEPSMMITEDQERLRPQKSSCTQDQSHCYSSSSSIATSTYIHLHRTLYSQQLPYQTHNGRHTAANSDVSISRTFKAPTILPTADTHAHHLHSLQLGHDTGCILSQGRDIHLGVEDIRSFRLHSYLSSKRWSYW